VDNIIKAIDLGEDSRIVDLCLQILRNLFVNGIIGFEKAVSLNIISVLQRLLDNNKRINLVAQIISKLAKNSDDIKSILMEDKTIIDSVIASIDLKGSSNFRVS